MKKRLAIILVSGGLDSCVTAAVAHQDYEMAFLHVNYGQRTEIRELKAFWDIAAYYSVKNVLVTDIEYLKKIGGSSLTDTSLSIDDHKSDTGGIPMTYVPFRNTHLLSIATSWAEVLCAEKIFIGAVEQDSTGYPDCRKEYFNAYKKEVVLLLEEVREIRKELDLMVFNLYGLTEEERRIVINRLECE